MSTSYQDEALYTLLCKYLLEEADAEERAWVEAWKADSSGNAALLTSLGKIIGTATSPLVVVHQEQTNTSWAQLSGKIAAQEAVPAVPEPKVYPMPERRSFGWWKVAAVLVILLGAGWWWLGGNTAGQQRYTGPVAAMLEDGSSVQVDTLGTVSLSKNFGKKDRKVSLHGKAMFDVTKDEQRPFIVTAGSTEVRVLGTRFTIDYQPEQAGLMVHVSTGKVMVIDHVKGDSVVLTDGMLLKRAKEQEIFKVATHVADINKKALVFHDAPLEEVLLTVCTVYNVKVSVADVTLLKTPVTATFTNEPIDNVLASLSFMTNSKWEKTGAQQYIVK
ncbi:FecR family protein [Chitinophaga defluvii]|uniref:FecR domain-containing protein n=1 Tax=Chitinophaga defluvii TaxID=3163343 RepID=A0ABV2TAG0_9BACT